ncbi:MAG: F0F1 ATP synthase subunit B [Sphingomonas sp.]|uniref:F0F1 ATP synthase subunit B family protein n=1 Tax=Sphingomonas sp. TaxID=28214 RepID=UPI001B0495B7|nr:F0F1 ATP synthase subunit B [Sphingomonas sp.]MBO9621346.1 F0F1 ATP synthase subunit B [Sphingomonas sp.]
MAEAAHAATAPATGGAAEQNLSATVHDMGVPETGTKAVTIEHSGPSEAHSDPAIFGLDATVWVSIAMLVFLLTLIWKKVPGVIARGLDAKIAEIRNRLEEAKQLRAEAEALREEYARKIAGLEAETQAMLAHADEEAKAVLARAEADAKELTKRRTKMAEDKIAAAELAAVQAIRAKAAEAATRAAAAIIADKHGAEADKSLIDQTIAGLGRLN